MIRVCVLGSIASGKSFISKLFNCPIFNADMEVVDIYKKDKSCFKKLNKNFLTMLSLSQLKNQN